MLKLSGEALQGGMGFGVEPKVGDSSAVVALASYAETLALFSHCLLRWWTLIRPRLSRVTGGWTLCAQLCSAAHPSSVPGVLARRCFRQWRGRSRLLCSKAWKWPL